MADELKMPTVESILRLNEGEKDGGEAGMLVQITDGCWSVSAEGIARDRRGGTQ